MHRQPTIGDKLGARARLGTPGRFSAAAVWMFEHLPGRFLAATFRPTLSGVEHLPDERPALIVANHSGGGAFEILLLALLWHRRFGASRPVTGMAHPLLFHLPLTGDVLRALGAIPATYEAAAQAFREGLSVLVFPGGEYDAFRPIWHARRVDFNRRKGFLRVARQAHVPIIPLGIHGSHYTLPFVWRSNLLPWITLFPRLLGVKRIGISLHGLLGLVALALLLGPWLGYPPALAIGALWLVSPASIFMPVIPWPVHARLGAPIPPEDLFGGLPDDDPLDDAYERVIHDIQELVHASSAPRR